VNTYVQMLLLLWTYTQTQFVYATNLKTRSACTKSETWSIQKALNSKQWVLFQHSL